MKPLSSSVRLHRGRPTLFLNDRPVLPYVYALTDCPGGRLSYEEYPAHSMRKFADSGVRLFQLDIWLEDLWGEDGSLDITMAVKQIRGVLEICPDAAVFFRFHTTPPRWWHARYPGECVEYADRPDPVEERPFDFERYLERDNLAVRRHSYASRRWRDDASAKLTLFLERLAARPEGDRLAGVHPATGVYGENHYWGFMSHEPDTCEPMERAFREHAEGALAGVAAGVAAGALRPPSGGVPGIEARRHTSDGIFRDPERERLTIEYYAFQHQLVAQSVVHFCRLVKETWPRDIVTGAFYGYYFSLFGRAATGGHLCEEIVLGSPYVDYLSAPQAYTRSLREVGGAGASRGLLDSARINGKLWLDEMDQPTHRDTLLGGMPVYDLETSVQILRRNIVAPFVRGQGLWFYDFGPHNHSGWWNHPRYQDEVREMRLLLEERSQAPYQNQSDVLFVYDTKTHLVTANSQELDPLTELTCANVSYPHAWRSGAAFDVVYLSDIEKVDWSRYRCVVFMNTFAMRDETKAYVRSHVLREGRHVWWVYAPGYSDFRVNSVGFVEELTGFRLEKRAQPGLAVRTDAGDYRLPDPGESHRLDWVLIPGDPEEVHGRYLSTGEVAIASRETPTHTSWFFSLPPTRAQVFRHFFRKCGVHLYNEHDDALLEGSGLLVLHTKEGGLRTLTMRDGRRVELELEPAETVVLDSATGMILRRG